MVGRSAGGNPEVGRASPGITHPPSIPGCGGPRAAIAAEALAGVSVPSSEMSPCPWGWELGA